MDQDITVAMDFLPLIVIALVLHLNVSDGMSARNKRTPFCQTRIDLAFVIDSSRSISREDFKLQMQFVNDIVSFLDVNADDTRVAAVSFSNFLHPEFLFNTYSTKEDVLKAIGGITHSLGDATRTYLALEHTHSVIYKAGNGERPDVLDVIIVLTDGETNPGSYDRHWAASGKRQTQIEAAKLKDRPAYVFAIGVGSGVDVTELNGISSDPDERFTIQVSSFKKLNSDDVKQMLLKRACVAVETTTVPITTVPITTAPITVPTESPQKNQECKEAVADIFFLLDESSSIKTVANFKKELSFVTSVVDYLEIGLTKSQVGVMTFSDQPKIKFHLYDYRSKTAIANAISDIKWKGGNTFLDRALAMVRRQGLNPRYGSRPDVPQIAVIITDGVSTDPRKTRKELKKLHAQNYILYAIGIGPRRNKAELELIANNPNNVFEVDSLDGLQAIRKSLTSRICVESLSVSAINKAAKKP